MKNKERELVVLYSDDNAATKQTVTGWVSRDGRFFGNDEHMARYSGCTHVKCDCGNIMTRSWTKCDSCRSKNSQDKYNSFEFQEWDGTTPLCIYGDDTYFFDMDDIEDYLDNNELEPEDLMLVICKPNYPSQISSEYWQDDLPEDGDIPKALKDKLDELNKFIETLEPLSWSGSNIRTEYKRD